MLLLPLRAMTALSSRQLKGREGEREGGREGGRVLEKMGVHIQNLQQQTLQDPGHVEDQ